MKTQRERMLHLAGPDKDDGVLYQKIVSSEVMKNFISGMIPLLIEGDKPKDSAMSAAVLALGRINAAIIGSLIGWMAEGEEGDGFTPPEHVAELMNLQLAAIRIGLEGEVPETLRAFKKYMVVAFGEDSAGPEEKTLKWMATMCAAVVSASLKSSGIEESEKIYILLKTLAHLFYVGLVTAVDEDKVLDVGKLTNVLVDLIQKRIEAGQSMEPAGTEDELSQAFMKK